MPGKHKFPVDINLLLKYDKPGPRYTSYPTAPQFHEGFGPEEFRNEIIESNNDSNTAPVSLYFHLPFCKSLCYYCGCNTIITQDENKKNRYIAYLKKEMDLISRHLSPQRKVIQIHWGGGTPTYFSPSQIREIFGHIQSSFNIDNRAEISIEIDPRRTTEEHLPTLRELGFNRISMGVQDFDPKVQETVNRIQPEEMTRRIVAQGRELNFDSINLDLIYGLPFQTVDSFKVTIDKILDINPDRLAVFNYAHVPWLKKHQNLLPVDALPKAEEKLKLFKMIIEELTANGYVFIGMDHFAKPEDELSIALKNRSLYRNFQGYTTRKGAEVFAMGITGISQLHKSYAQNVKSITEYEKLLDSGKIPTQRGFKLSEDDVLRRDLITVLMCNNFIPKTAFEQEYGIEFDTYFANALEKLKPFEAEGLLTHSDSKIVVSEPGRLIIRNIAMAFDPYLEKDQQKDKPIYSRTV